MKEHILDTHTLVYWLLNPKSLPRKALAILSDPNHTFKIPTIALLEVQYLIEIGRIDTKIEDVLKYIESNPNFMLHSYDEPALRESVKPTSHRDPFDRIILATARALNLPIFSKDRWMAKNYNHCIWK